MVTRALFAMGFPFKREDQVSLVFRGIANLLFELNENGKTHWYAPCVLCIGYACDAIAFSDRTARRANPCLVIFG